MLEWKCEGYGECEGMGDDGSKRGCEGNVEWQRNEVCVHEQEGVCVRGCVRAYMCACMGVYVRA